MDVDNLKSALGGVKSAGGFMSAASPGVLSVFEPPTGPGVRVDGYGYAGYRTNPNFDSLLAKVIVHAATFDAAMVRAERALAAFRHMADAWRSVGPGCVARPAPRRAANGHVASHTKLPRHRSSSRCEKIKKPYSANTSVQRDDTSVIDVGCHP